MAKGGRTACAVAPEPGVPPAHGLDGVQESQAPPAAAAADSLLLSAWALLDAAFVLLSVPFRAGFLFDPWARGPQAQGWTRVLTALSVLDALGVPVRIWLAARTLRAMKPRASHRAKRKTPSLRWISTRHLALHLTARRSDAVHPLDLRHAHRSKTAASHKCTIRWTQLLLVLFALLPLDLVAAGMRDYNALHIAGAGKLLFAGSIMVKTAPRLLERVRRARWTRRVVLTTPFWLFWIGLFLCHLAACGYMLLANVECGLQSERCSKTPVPGSWVLRDNMEQAHLWRRYVRSMYWASKTITTLGQGDLVPATLAETNYCIIVQFISGLWATAFLASCSFYFQQHDCHIESGVSTQLEQALRFLKARSAAPMIALQLRHFFEHVQRTRDGMDEELAILSLPRHYQVEHTLFIKMRILMKIPTFFQQSKLFLREVVQAMEVDFLAPGQCVLRVRQVDELVIVVLGELYIRNGSGHDLGILRPDDWHGEKALFEHSRSKVILEAKTHCEVLRLSRTAFLEVATKVDYVVPSLADAVPWRELQLIQEPQSGQQGRSSISRSSFQHQGSIVRLSHSKRADSKPLTQSLWRYPGSRFRCIWRRCKLCALLFIAVEAPYEVAFDWRNGFVRRDEHKSIAVVYALSLLAEVFMYVDLYFRMFKFARMHSRDEDEYHPALVSRNTDDASDLATTRRSIFRLYLQQDSKVMDVLVTLPISTIWNCLDQSAFSMEFREIMRFSRLLSMGRLVGFKSIIHKIMVEFDLSPASQLLTLVIVFCIITANALACYFYLLADDKAFVDALPIGFDPDATPLSASQCLEQATLYANCSWFISDRSVFAIKARYIRSMHWSLVLLSTVGYGDILSFSDSECLLGFWWIYLSALICYFTSCAVGSVISQVTVVSNLRAERMEEINRVLKHSNISESIRWLVRSHYETNWKLNGSTMRESALSERLPRTLRQELQCSMYLGLLGRSAVFAGFGDNQRFLVEIAVLIRLEAFQPGVVVVERGHVISAAYFVHSGRLELLASAMMRTTAFTQGGNIPRRHVPEVARSSKWWQCLWCRDQSVVKSITRLSRLSRPWESPERDMLSIPLAVLHEGDMFGEEGLILQEQLALRATVRSLTSAQVAILDRNALSRLADRFSPEVAQLMTAVRALRFENEALEEAIVMTLQSKHKPRRVLGISRTVVVAKTVRQGAIVTPDRWLFRIWRVGHGAVVLFNFYQIVFRLAFLSNPSRSTMKVLTIVDYLLDCFLFGDIYLKWTRFGFETRGENVVDIQAIRQRYRDGWLMWDLASMLPVYYIGDHFIMTMARLPRLLKSPQLIEYVNDLEAAIRQRGGSSTLGLFGLVKFFVFFLSAAHYVGSVYFLLGRLLTQTGSVQSSWMTEDAILTADPDDIAVQYVRALYWCLETFTVVCFGDVLARNAVETAYASAACIIGWVCVGQITGRMASIMANLDKDAHDYNLALDNFEQYAKHQRLPLFLRERAIEGIEYKAKCWIELNLERVFEDLPQGLHVQLFSELYQPLVSNVPELAKTLSAEQIRVVVNALQLRVFLADDLILEEARLGSRFCILREGRAEYFESRSKVVLGAIDEGASFGGVAFFLPGVRELTAVRAVTSCQVLQLTRKRWESMWPESTRVKLDAMLGSLMQEQYRVFARAFTNIYKNLEPISKKGRVATAAPTTTHQTLSDVSTSTGSFATSSCLNSVKEQEDLPRVSERADKITSVQPVGLVQWIKRQSLVEPLNKIQPVSPPASGQSDQSQSPGYERQRRLTSQLGVENVANQLHPPEFPWQHHDENVQILQAAEHYSNYDASMGPQAIEPQLSSITSIVARNPIGEPSVIESSNSKNGIPPWHTAISTSAQLSRAFQATHVTENDPWPAVQGQDSSYCDHLEALQKRSHRKRRLTMFSTTRQVDGDPKQIWFEPPLPPLLFAENSLFRRAWNSLMLFVTLYYVLVVPFRISFHYERLEFQVVSTRVLLWFGVEYCMDMLLVLDFVLHMNCFTFIHRGELVTNVASIRRHFWKEGSFVVDLMSFLPFEVLIPISPFLPDTPLSTSKITWYRIAVFRISKLLRVVHLSDLWHRFQHMLLYDFLNWSIKPSVLYFVWFAFSFALGAHWVACLFYSATYIALVDDGQVSWLRQAGMLTFEGVTTLKEIGAVSILTRFARSYHFGMGAITTVSYGDIAPQNAWETFVALFVIVASISLFGMLSGGFLKIFETEFGKRADYEERIAMVDRFMAFHRFPESARQQVEGYFSSHWSTSKGMNEEELLSGLPASVLQDIVWYVKRDLIKQMRLFLRCEVAYIRAVVVAFDQELYVPGDVIISYGDRERSLYVIESGNVLLRVPRMRDNNCDPMQDSSDAASTTWEREFIKGPLDFFGEKSLVLDVPRSATCVALSICSMLILTLDKYESVLDEFPEYREKNRREWVEANACERSEPPSYSVHASP